MIIVSINIRGLGGRLKKKEIRDLISVNDPDFVCIRDTKIQVVDSVLCASLWGSDDVGWAFVLAEGFSGGIMSLWKKSIFVCHEIRLGSNFVMVRGNWSMNNVFCNIMNTYSPCDLARKRLFWEEAKNVWMDHSGESWCMVGDFNVILHRDEKKGSSSIGSSRVSVEFARFVEELELVDLPLVGSKFTWFLSNGSTMNRLDRLLVNDSWLTLRGRMVQKALKRSYSDHCLILLKNDVPGWGPSPFRTNNFWFSDAGFMKFVEDEWKKLEFVGRGSFFLKEKLKCLKSSLKIWNYDHFGNLDRKIVDQVSMINVIDAKGCDGTLPESDISVRCAATADLWRLSSPKDNLLIQKSRQRWLRDGDSNSKFFHASINRRRRYNEVHGLFIEDDWVEDPVRVKNHVRSFSKNRFSEFHWNMPSLDGIEFKRLSDENNLFLTARFEEPEVKEAVWSCDEDKSLGPHGYNFTFIKKFWDCVKVDILEMVSDFFFYGNVARGCNSSFIVLILKNGSPQNLYEYRPISLVGCIYKIISKILAGRLKKVIHLVIFGCQSAFIQGRFIMDGVLIANEVIDQARKSKEGDCFIFKVDFEKAYDSVNWIFLLYMMERMGFCFKWRNWIKSCLQSNFVSVLVNGSPTREFTMNCGLRQGDPIAPFLFLIVAEGLAGIMDSAVAKKIFKGYQVGRDKVIVYHLQYADDTLLIGENSVDNVLALKCILKCFELASGLRINFHKSKLIGIKSSESFVQMAVNKLLCGIGSIPFKFLGIPVGANPRRSSMWNPIIDSFKKKLSFWQQKLFSFGGRITLLKSVLCSLPIYYFSFFKASASVIKALERIQRRFLWGRGEESKGIHWVKWETVCRSREDGGLGIKNLKLFNLSLLGKWRWRLLSDSGSMWVRVLRSRYGYGRRMLVGTGEGDWFRKGSVWWRDIGSLNPRVSRCSVECFCEGVRRRVGCGDFISFWSDSWVSGGGGYVSKVVIQDCFRSLW
ncbi:unnamed protein product [Lupinus luteus]|uniref:Reverse transcriptase domain-containing protein n=1 Tax=Lupinus luteus TaxID=3873 RepID=A0AAV1W221_LUPLU